MAGFRTCTHPPITAALRARADELAIEENPLNGPDLSRAGSDAPVPMLRAAIRIGTKWKNGRTLRVRFLNGSDKQKSKVRQYANEWTKYANIKFDFVTAGRAEVRVNFDNSRSTWSAVGTECLAWPDDKPTVNFGDLPDAAPERNFSADILHEFGHVLGCIHEHQSPSFSIPWDKPVVYQYYKGLGMSRSEVDINVLNRSNPVGILSSEFDRDSIMLYPIPAEFTKGKYSSGDNWQLSAKDKMIIAEAYPPAPTPVFTFNTMEVRNWDDTGRKASKIQALVGDYSTAPSLAVGLNWLDVNGATNIRVKAHADRIKKNSAKIHIDTWSDTRLYSASCTWFHAAATDPDFQIGQFSTEDNKRVGDAPPKKTIGTVNFPRPYSSPPNVIVWLNELDLGVSSPTSGWRIRAQATDVTTKGFKFRLEAGGDTVPHLVGAAWIAHPADKVGVVSGTFSTSKKGIAKQSGQVSYPSRSFNSKPTVLAAFSSLNFGRSMSLRTMVATESSSSRNMKWRIETWSDGVLNSAEASYIAFI
ncbi:hypothetical protein QBC43DRAFT_318948 [Cladorrhinum sp. PSN259]|nr:hypothetical protein QBC43DRAFT_318948 [Cladorrhinum sp. PSN259]